MKVKNLPAWHKAVCERDKYICQLQTSPKCKRDYSDDYFFNNGVNQYLCGDHLRTQKSHPELVLETTNGKAVCFDCHTARHKGIIPQGYLEPAEETEETYSIGFNKAGKVETYVGIRTVGKPCKKCKKYLGMAASGLCMGCEPRALPNFKKPKKNETNKGNILRKNPGRKTKAR